MERAATSWMIVAAALLCALPVARAARVGEHAPDFSVTDTNGKAEKLSDYAGKFVVLEWSNRGCPYTQKHYNSGNMQRLQQEWTPKGSNLADSDFLRSRQAGICNGSG